LGTLQTNKENFPFFLAHNFLYIKITTNSHKLKKYDKLLKIEISSFKIPFFKFKFYSVLTKILYIQF